MKLIYDFLGNLIPRENAVKINNQIYEKNVTAFLMEDEKWYAITSTDKIIFDYGTEKYKLIKNFPGSINVIVDKNLKIGASSDLLNLVTSKIRIKSSGKFSTDFAKSHDILNQNLAEQLGYIECYADGFFYKKEEITAEYLTSFTKKMIPDSERSKSYNLEKCGQSLNELKKNYEKLNEQPTIYDRRIAKILGNFTFGFEVEVINGFLPRRIADKYGMKALKDGSLRHDGGEGIEYVSIPISGPKGIMMMRKIFEELNKRCIINDYCALHFHIGNVRKDKIFAIAFYNLIYKIQKELIGYFPWSRTNSIKSDGKVYCKPYEMDLKTNDLFSAKTEEEFETLVFQKFKHIYKWLNDGQDLGSEFQEPTLTKKVIITSEGKKMFKNSWIKNIYTVKSINHSIKGEKWNRHSRYSIFNLLNLYFSKSGTIESRISESTLNSDKAIAWLIISTCLIKYVDSNLKDCLNDSKVTIEQILKKYCTPKQVISLTDYLKNRYEHFKNSSKETRITIEKNWFTLDQNYKIPL